MAFLPHSHHVRGGKVYFLHEEKLTKELCVCICVCACVCTIKYSLQQTSRGQKSVQLGVLKHCTIHSIVFVQLFASHWIKDINIFWLMYSLMQLLPFCFATYKSYEIFFISTLVSSFPLLLSLLTPSCFST